MSYRTNRRTRGVFKLSGREELDAKLREDLKLIGRPDRYETLNSAIQEQIRKATSDYADNSVDAGYVPIADYSANIWQQIAGAGPEGMRSSKPKDGRAAYVWRMLRFHTGVDTHMPVMADFDVDREVDKEFGVDYYLEPFGSDAYNFKRGKHDEIYKVGYNEQNPVYTAQRRERKKLDAVVEYILAYQYPVNQFKAALRWQGLLY